MSKKIYYLSSEVDPFSNTYSLSTFSKELCRRLHDIDDFDIRLNQPKYGYISERKYILREVIRLKDMLIDFSNCHGFPTCFMKCSLMFIYVHRFSSMLIDFSLNYIDFRDISMTFMDFPRFSIYFHGLSLIGIDFHQFYE